MIIYGAGMAGLIAATMLRRFKPIVMEAKGTLPGSHKAVLRFRSEAVARATGQPFQRHKVKKAIKWHGEVRSTVPLDAANAYSLKVTGRVMNRSIGKLEEEERWIAPSNFLQVLAEQATIKFSQPLIDLPDKLAEPAISTIPMPVVVNKVLNLKETPSFSWRNILVVRAELACTCDVYQTIYYPSDDVNFYRASLEGQTLIVEFPQSEPDWLDAVGINAALHSVLTDFGLKGQSFTRLPETHLQPFGKIMPVDEQWRRHFIFDLTQKKNVYSLGRFATWRQILLDDVVKDVEQIERMISAGDDYGRRLVS